MAFALAGTGIPTLGSEHIVPQHYRTRRLEFLLLIMAARLLKKITTLSKSIRSTYPPSVRSKMVVMPNPVHKPLVQRKKYADKNKRTLLNIGRLVNQKDQATFIKAFAKIADEFPDYQLRIVGDGPLLNNLKYLVEELGLVNRVTLPGTTPNIDNEYLAADIFVISSYYEAFGLVTAEAMSHGLPVVGFADCPGTNELIQHETTGILVNPTKNRSKELATALSGLIKNPILQERLGRAGKKAIDKNFSTEQICSQWENLLISTIREQT
jgi:glycosyltransferase involved in cell wall biosynthesis